jgi:hypothetical protein
MDPWAFKKDEIGNHRKYSKKTNGATADTLVADVADALLQSLTHHPVLLKPTPASTYLIVIT